jgi:hypothetical protein
MIKECLDKGEMHDFFFKQKEMSTSAADEFFIALPNKIYPSFLDDVSRLH